MKIILEPTTTDPRIFNVVIDFTGYPYASKFFPLSPITWSGARAYQVPIHLLDYILADVKLRRIKSWSSNWAGIPGYRRVNVYKTTVISDREI